MPLKLVWAVTWLTMIAVIVSPVAYVIGMMDDPAVESTTSPEADSWGIPLFGDLIVGVGLAVVVYRLTIRFTRRYGRPGLLVWRGDRRSLIVTLAAIVVAALPVLVVAYDYFHAAPSYESALLPLVILGVVWVAMLRASAITMGELGEISPDAGRS